MEKFARFKRDYNVAYNKSKAKGSAFESKVKQIFTEHFGVAFERVPLSGALDYLKGDIWCPAMYHTFPYCVECKHYKELNFNSLLTAKSNDLFSFWEQVQEETKVMKSINPGIKPLVVFRWDRGKNLVMWNDEIIVKDQLHVKAHGHEFKIAELNKWLPQVKIKSSW